MVVSIESLYRPACPVTPKRRLFVSVTFSYKCFRNIFIHPDPVFWTTDWNIFLNANEEEEEAVTYKHSDKILGAHSACGMRVEKNLHTTLLFLLKFHGNRECMPNQKTCFDKIQFISKKTKTETKTKTLKLYETEMNMSRMDCHPAHQ